MYVHSIFKSISGEVSGCGQGAITAFLRLQGCNCVCEFCDTPETQQQKVGTDFHWTEVFDAIHSLNTKNLIITGGEPLLQAKELKELCESLLVNRIKITVETNGSIPITELGFKEITYVVDFKLQLSEKMMLFTEFCDLKESDFIKFVVENNEDILQANQIQEDLVGMGCLAQFAYSPMIEGYVISNKDIDLCKTIYNALDKNHLEGIINLQLHKFLNFK